MDLAQGSDWWSGPLPTCGDRSVLAVAEGGDRVVRLLAARPRRMAVVDRNPAQLRLTELKRAAVQALDYKGYLELTGLVPSRRRRSLYQRIRWMLRSESDDYWLGRLSLLDRGVAFQGTFERRLASYRHVVRLIQGRRRCTRYLELPDAESRRRFLVGEWDTFLWRRFGPSFWERWFRAPAVHLDRLLIEGRLLQPPPAISPEVFERAKESANRMLIVDGPPEAYLRSLPDRSVDVFVLGRMDLEGLEEELSRAASPGARATLVTERDPQTCLKGFVTEREPSEAGFFPGRLIAGSFPV